MKSPPLLLSEIKLIPLSSLRKNMQREEIIAIGENIPSVYHTPGSGIFECDKKENSSGIYYENEFRYSIPSYGSPQDIQEYNKIGAVILKTESERKIVFYNNDFFSNTPIRLAIQSTLDKTYIKGNIISIYPL